MADILTFYHFNDVYHISDVDLISKFAHVFTRARQDSKSPDIQPLTIFSGDVFSPSTESSVLKGEHMVPILNHLDIDIACYGNHDFDFGESRLIELSGKTNFPWILSNVVHATPHKNPDSHVRDGSLLALAQEYVIKTMGQYKIGFIGLAGTDWPSNCQHLPPAHFLSPAEVAHKLAVHLRTVEGCDFVIAVTHMRLAEDLSVSNATLDGDGRIDLLLGGHDHDVVCRILGDTDDNPGTILKGIADSAARIRNGEIVHVEGNVRVIKSGTDWRSYSVVQLKVRKEGDGKAQIDNIEVTQYLDLTRMQTYQKIPKCSKTLSILGSIQNQIMEAVRHPLFHTRVPLDGRSTVIRSQETNLGNMLADAVRAFYDTDIAFINSGGVRCDRIIAETNGNNALKVKDIIGENYISSIASITKAHGFQCTDIMPFDNAFVVKRVGGATLLSALENSISDSHTDGRFLQVSGMRFKASWQRPEGSRVLGAFFEHKTGELEDINPGRSYTIAMVSFIATGFDGYDCFKAEETLVDAESAMTDTSLMLQIFRHSRKSNHANEKVEDKNDAEGDDKTEMGVKRAMEAIITGYDDIDGLPIVSPVLDNRLTFV
ncbi:2,3-cyclic-nucleotide 2-phosphodiesterase [Trichophyton interdigitale]|uniref:Trifunctional nucleotide phosphoesterase protein YfkN n=1 Tax=Trichophyton interdigitale TaxID=101480 RepID=A0A9P4YNC3_9EURO|nr:Trifunctional nucleotide phosphoesterase protein YfkN [Trichophyton interdigitale]KAF3901144.1 Trifunctional nucleotide phosphoesterase protein YfkN [Trichophyton interdigitale]KAG8211355.1 2,3-cyclic-nucleotide 2-phosphodiesterase [Trichophyton interdigitale]